MLIFFAYRRNARYNNYFYKTPICFKAKGLTILMSIFLH